MSVPLPGERVLLGVGSNQGDRAAELRAGAAALDARSDTRVVGASGLWESRYVGPGAEQAPYLNGCLELRTELEPRDLLEVLQAVERHRGRPADGHLKPRPLDLDILLFGERTVATPDLRIPHPEMSRRAFVLEPLAELAPELVPPDSQVTVAEIRAKIRGVGGPWVRRWSGPGWRDESQPPEG